MAATVLTSTFQSRSGKRVSASSSVETGWPSGTRSAFASTRREHVPAARGRGRESRFRRARRERRFRSRPREQQRRRRKRPSSCGAPLRDNPGAQARAFGLAADSPIARRLDGTRTDFGIPDCVPFCRRISRNLRAAAPRRLVHRTGCATMAPAVSPPNTEREPPMTSSLPVMMRAVEISGPGGPEVLKPVVAHPFRACGCADRSVRRRHQPTGRTSAPRRLSGRPDASDLPGSRWRVEIASVGGA